VKRPPAPLARALCSWCPTTLVGNSYVVDGRSDPHADGRLTNSGPLVSGIVMLALLAAICTGLFERPPVAAAGRASAKPPDVGLYLRIINDVHAGRDYYDAAFQAQRAEGYPVRPFVAVRLPTAAIAMAALPDAPARVLSLQILAIVTLLAWVVRLRDLWGRPKLLGAAVLVLASGILPSFAASAYLFHECWAGLLIALSLAVRGSRLWPLAVTLGLAACAVRELAAPYLLAMAAMAMKDGRRVEAVGWLAAIAAFACGLWLHAAAVSPRLRAGDQASPGWLALGGWPFLLSSLRWNIPLGAARAWLLAILAPVALLGLADRRDPLGERLALTVWGYCVAFLFVGRPDNAYWGLLIAPIWPLGFLTAWQAVRGIGRGLSQIESGRWRG